MRSILYKEHHSILLSNINQRTTSEISNEEHTRTTSQISNEEQTRAHTSYPECFHQCKLTLRIHNITNTSMKSVIIYNPYLTLRTKKKLYSFSTSCTRRRGSCSWYKAHYSKARQQQHYMVGRKRKNKMKPKTATSLKLGKSRGLIQKGPNIERVLKPEFRGSTKF